VAAGKNALSLNEVQPEGKRRMDAAAFLRGHASILQAAR
jgi:methionyl-tRNA formyltransferase